MSELGLTLLAGLLMLVGVVGVVAPVLPDAPLVWLAALGYGLLVGWGRLGPYLFVLITFLGLAAAAAEIWGSTLGAKAGGASIWGVLAGLLLGLIGLIFLGPLGGIGGLLLGTFLVELIRVRDTRQAARGMLGMGVGFGMSILVKLGLVVSMVVVWIVWVVVG
ncbi:MAG: DUF456 family protein [Anaerolineales bacterium]